MIILSLSRFEAPRASEESGDDSVGGSCSSKSNAIAVVLSVPERYPATVLLLAASTGTSTAPVPQTPAACGGSSRASWW